jgi:hypothetical protein
MENLRSSDVVSYLHSAGWTRQYFPRADVIVFAGPKADDGEAIEVVIPASEDASDFRDRIREVLSTVSALENRKPADLACEIHKHRVWRRQWIEQTRAALIQQVRGSMLTDTIFALDVVEKYLEGDARVTDKIIADASFAAELIGNELQPLGLPLAADACYAAANIALMAWVEMSVGTNGATEIRKLRAQYKGKK